MDYIAMQVRAACQRFLEMGWKVCLCRVVYNIILFYMHEIAVYKRHYVFVLVARMRHRETKRECVVRPT